MDDTPDLDTNAFLESVRELKEKRQREDNERQEQLEAQIASSRLARKLESERGMSSPSMSPSTSPHRASPSNAVPSRASTLSRPPRSRPMSVDMGSPTRASSVRPMSMMSIPEKGTPLPSRDSQRFAAPDSADGLSRTMSSAQSRLDRPSSPTKGMGGFVQSAMLKRNDSVNKRWSVTAGPSSLTRNDSTASFRSAANADDTPTRPSSSHSTISNLNIAPDSDIKEERPERSTTTRHSRSRSMASFSGQDPIPEGLMSPPLSPNKRWSRSPTKASWLESALTRPDSPKPLASPQSTQPSWMADLAKAKQQRGTAEASPSQENIDAVKVQDTPTFGQGLLKKSTLRDTPTHSPSASRNVTPPTKAKPISLAGKSALPEPSTPSLDLTPKLSEKTELEKQEPTKEVSKKEENEQTLSKEEDPVDSHHLDKVQEDTPKKEEPVKSIPSKPIALSSRFTEKEPIKPAAQKPSALSSVPNLPPKSQALDSVNSTASSSPRFPTLKSPDLRSGEFKSPELKQETTPKTDFRSGLKSRSGTIGAQTEQEPEFKALFGKLKKAQTEKYVAPDELKNNILRGKAGLSLSAGPQKTERRDELKESLLKKKEEMTKAAAEKPASEPKVSPAPSSVPEALSVRKQLGRSNSTLNIPAPAKSHRDITPEALSFHKNLRGKPKAPLPEKRSSVAEKAELKRASMESKPSSVADEKHAESVPQTEDKPEPETKELPKPETRELTKPVAQELPKRVQQESSKPQVQTRPMSNKIADRFNPALAGLLARGPPSASNTPPSGSPFSPPAISRVSSAQDEPGEGTQLTHMTKSRAKGPKRRKPKSGASETTAKATPAPETRVSSIVATSEKRVSSIASESEKRVSSAPSVPEKRISSINMPSPSSPSTKGPVQPPPKSAAVRAASVNLSKPQISEAEKPKTPTPTKSMTFPPVRADKPNTPVSARSSLELATAAGAEKPKPVTPSKPTLNTPASTTSDKLESPAPLRLPLRTSSSASPISKEPAPGPISPLSASRQPSGFNRALPGKALPGMTTSRPQDKPLPPLNSTEAGKENQSFSSVKSAASMWGKPTQTTPQKRAPIELPTKKDEEAAMLSAGLLSNSPLRYNASPKLGLGITEDTINQPARTNGHDQVQSPSTGAPPKPAKSSRVVSGQLSAKDLPHLPNVLDLPAGHELVDFFGNVPQSSNQLQLNTDTQTVLGSRSGESDKIKTLRNSIQEIKSDGTLIPLPAQQEHILYESSMYICTHVFYTANMTRMAEVYLWCGDRISESTILETQVHAKRVAREAGVGQKSTQLYIIDQAREPANFFQALGGIVITRRGSRAESLKEPYMLCGRPHMGHIAFDEVDRRKSSLCSEYPYIIARPITLQETKIWLWKGSGCGATAIGSTRLISMDLNPGGGFTEIDEGRETAEFLAEIHDAGDTSICQSPALWKGRCGNWEHSSVRLFRIEAKEKPKQTAASLFTSYFSRRPSWSAPKSPNTDRPNSDGSSKSPNAEFEASISEIAPFTQDDLEPEGCYVLDANSDILVLPGPLLSQQGSWQHAFVQACLFAHDYAILSASLEDRPAIPKARVVLGGLPKEIKVKFRRWEERRGLWGSGGLMAGKITGGDGGMIDVRDVLGVCCGP